MISATALKDFFKSIATFSGDLASITAPAWILAPQSMVEFPGYWAERPELFVAPATGQDAGERMLAVLKLYLASLCRQGFTGMTKESGLKKPLNPILGEVFMATWGEKGYSRAGQGQGQQLNGGSGMSCPATKVISEQVSHHPPTTACVIESLDGRVTAHAYSSQATTLSGTAVLVRQFGHALIHLRDLKEDYLLPLPDIRAYGWLGGRLYPVVTGKYEIVGTTGWRCAINFEPSGGGFFSKSGAKKNWFEAEVVNTQGGIIYTVGGSWTESFQAKDAHGQLLWRFDVEDLKNQHVEARVPAVESMDPWESRRVWEGVIRGLKAGDNSLATKEKTKVENAQREMRKREKQEGKEWQRWMFFRDDSILEQQPLGSLMDMIHDADLRQRLQGKNGCWRYDPEKGRTWNNEEMKQLRQKLTPMSF